MGKSICSIPDCARPHYGHGWCNKHYSRWRKHGDPLVTKHYWDPEDAFAAYAKKDGDCITWCGSIHRTGYGTLKVSGKQVMAHRYAWERVNGVIPDGMLIDHTCWNKACVNLEHLRIATYLQNSRYRNGPMKRKRDGARNVYREGNKWRVIIGYKKQLLHFGHYETLEEAMKVASEKRKELFGDFAGKGGKAVNK